MTYMEQGQFNKLVDIAEKNGYRVIVDWLDGCGGSECQATGTQWIMLDRGVTVPERSKQLFNILKSDRRITTDQLSTVAVTFSGEYPKTRAA